MKNISQFVVVVVEVVVVVVLVVAVVVIVADVAVPTYLRYVGRYWCRQG